MVQTNNWQGLFQKVMHDHIKQCIQKPFDRNGEEKKKLNDNIQLAEQKFQEKNPLPWPRTLNGVNDRQKISFREQWKLKFLGHPYFAYQEYTNMVLPNLDTNEYPVVSPDGLNRLSPLLLEIYKTYSSVTPAVCAPPSLSDAVQYLGANLTWLYECYRENGFETVAFACLQFCTMPELIKLLADPPIPRKILLDKKTETPIYKYAHLCQSSVIELRYSIYANKQNQLLPALFLLSCITVWHVFPNPEKRLEIIKLRQKQKKKRKQK